jgi:hypothetical protein
MFRTLLTLAVCAWAATASAQQWAEKMFSDRSIDFGAVPRDATTEHEFKITNLYKEDVHIAGVRASCGCTSPRIVNDTLSSHETGAIIAAFNTRGFTGQHSARVTVTFDRPQWAEVELNVRGYIRTDVVLEPGQVALGSVPLGEKAEKKIKIEHYGRDDWKLTGVTSDATYIEPSLREVSRSSGRVVYELDVKLNDDAPAGIINDRLVLATNDRREQFPVKVEGRVVTPLSVSPTSLVLGTLQPGQKVQKRIVVRGTKPFTILEVRCDDEAFAFDVPKQAGAVHLIPVTFVAGSETGKISRKIEIVTDLAQQPTVELLAIGQVAAPLAQD